MGDESPTRTSQDETEPLTLTAAEVAEMLSLHPSTVYRLAQRGDLPHIRIGNIVRFPRRAIRELLEVA